MKIRKLMGIAEHIAPRALAKKWDNVGLLVGSEQREVERIIVCLDIEEAVVRAAAEKNAQVIISHHPVIFRPISAISLDDHGGRVLRELLAGGIAALAMHTNLDSARGGVNDVLAAAFDLNNLEALEPAHRFSPEEGTAPEGLGRAGDLPRPVSMLQFIEQVKTVLAVDTVRVVGPMDRQVGRVAVMGGSGGRSFRRAGRLGFDVLVTGDVGYHDALEAAADGVTIIDAGHRETERIVLDPLAERFRELTRRAGDPCEVEVIYPGDHVFITK